MHEHTKKERKIIHMKRNQSKAVGQNDTDGAETTGVRA